MTTPLFAGLSALGTIAIAVLAIWGDWFRTKLAGPKLVLQPLNLRGEVTTFTDGRKVLYYHLEVVNERTWSKAKDCRVLLVGVSLRVPDGNFLSVAAPQIPLQWRHPQLTPIEASVAGKRPLDLGYLPEPRGGEPAYFTPALYLIPNNFQGYVGCNQAVRYTLEIEASHFTPSRRYVYEVAWDGEWSDNLDWMAQHLVIKELDGAAG